MPSWRRTASAVWLAEFMSLMGFGFVTPFLPYYIQDLGVHDVKEVAAWTAATTSVMSIGMAVMAPVWGMLGDRHGRRVMLLRAIFCGAVTMALLTAVTNVQQLLVLRLLQGILLGTVPAASALVATVAPRERCGQALGSLQTAVFLGSGMGPVLGGPIGDALGYRCSFWIACLVFFVAGLLVLLFVREQFCRPALVRQGSRERGNRAAWVLLVSRPLLAVFAVRFIFRFGAQTVPPMLPLFIQALEGSADRAGTITGLVYGVSALGSALGALILGRWSDRYGHRQLLLLGGFCGGLAFLMQSLIAQEWLLIVLQFLSGFAVGGLLVVSTALMVKVSPAGHEGIIFGIDTSVISGAAALAPLAGAAALAAAGLRAPFVAAGGALMVAAAVAAGTQRREAGELKLRTEG